MLQRKGCMESTQGGNSISLAKQMHNLYFQFMLQHTSMLHTCKTVLEHLRLFKHQAWRARSLPMMQRAGDSVHIAQMQLVQRAHCSKCKCKCQSCHAVQHLHPVVLTLCVTATLRFSCIGTISSRKLSTWRTLMHKDLREPLTRRCKSLNGTASVDQYLGCCGFSVTANNEAPAPEQDIKLPQAEVCFDVLERTQAVRTEKIYKVTNSQSQR